MSFLEEQVEAADAMMQIHKFIMYCNEQGIFTHSVENSWLSLVVYINKMEQERYNKFYMNRIESRQIYKNVINILSNEINRETYGHSAIADSSKGQNQ